MFVGCLVGVLRASYVFQLLAKLSISRLVQLTQYAVVHVECDVAVVNNPMIVFTKILLKNEFPDFFTWNQDSRPLNPILGVKFCVESEFAVKKCQIRPPEAKNQESRTRKK